MRNRVARRSPGFTLIEVIIVIAIVLALGGLVAYNVLGRQKQAKADICKIDMNNIKNALKNFRLDFDRYPKDEEGLKVLWDKTALAVDSDADTAKWHKYLESALPNDRWDMPWNYKQVGEHNAEGDEDMYDLWSNGPDKQEGTDDDIVSWTKDDTGTGTTPATTGGSKSKGG